MMHENVSGIKNVIQSLGKLSLAVLSAVMCSEIFNRLVQKIYPNFNPKKSWTSNGSLIQAMPSMIIAGAVALYVGSQLKDYQFPNLLIPSLAIIGFIIWLYKANTLNK